MNPTLEELKLTVSHLSDSERAALGKVLLETLEPEEEDVAAAWRTEVVRRMAEVRAGRVQGIPAEEVLAGLREKYP